MISVIDERFYRYFQRLLMEPAKALSISACFHILALTIWGTALTNSVLSQSVPINTAPASESDLSPSLPVAPPLPETTLRDDSSSSFDNYRLGPGDSIFISVRRFPELSIQATLDIQGNVIVPIQGTVSLENLTLEEARQELLRVYGQYVYLEPDAIALTLTAQRGVRVTIIGEVTRPGFYPLPSPDVSTALLSAGGSTLNADLRQIRIQRAVDGRAALSRTIDLFTPLKAGHPLPNVPLQDGDVVVVPRLDADRLDEYDRALVATSTLAQQQITVRVLNYAAGSRGNQGNLGALNLRNGSRFIDAISQININPDRVDLRNVAVVRFNPEEGQADTIIVDANAAINGDISQNIPLQDNDVIILDRNTIAQITYTLNTFTQPFRDVLGFLLFFDSIADAADNLFRP
mgnify:CR=1 FL=1